MPPKRKVATDSDLEPDDGNGDELADSGSSKRMRAGPLPETSIRRRSARNGRGTGGQMAQLQNIERVQFVPTKSKRMAYLDAATKDQEVNPMAPSTVSQQTSRSRPQPRLKSKQDLNDQEPIATQASNSSGIRPSFSLAAQGQQFGFRLPDHDGVDSPPASRASSIFSADVSRVRDASTAPTSRANSVCSDRDGSSRHHSSHLRALALASQAGLHAPARVSRVSSSSGFRAEGSAGAPHENRRQLGGARSAATLFDEPVDGLDLSPRRPMASQPPAVSKPMEEPTTSDDADDEPQPPPPRRTGVYRTSSFYRLPQVINEDHTIFASNNLEVNDDIEIDEVSPSEDDRLAELALRREDGARRVPLPQVAQASAHISAPRLSRRSEGHTEHPQVGCALAPIAMAPYPHRSEDHTHSPGDSVEDVVAAHRQRNRAPRLPSNSQLTAVRQQQRAVSMAVSSQREVTQPPELPAEPGHPRSQIGAATEGADPSQLQFYEPAVRDMIERAKQFSHCDAASINAFPHRAEFNKHALEYVEEAIQERQAQSLVVPDGWWPQYANDICKLLWEDLGNWRSSLRKRARTFATQRYQWDAENSREANKEIAKKLLGDNGLFLRDGVDGEGRTNNLAHPALAGLVLDFFYGGEKSVGHQFPEVFSEEVPRVAVAIATTALKVVLDEAASSQGEVNFRVTTYSPVYLEMLGLMKKCDTSTVHAKKTKALRCKWAEIGSGGSIQAGQARVAASSSFDVVLD